MGPGQGHLLCLLSWSRVYAPKWPLHLIKSHEVPAIKSGAQISGEHIDLYSFGKDKSQPRHPPPPKLQVEAETEHSGLEQCMCTSLSSIHANHVHTWDPSGSQSPSRHPSPIFTAQGSVPHLWASSPPDCIPSLVSPPPYPGSPFPVPTCAPDSHQQKAAEQTPAQPDR